MIQHHPADKALQQLIEQRVRMWRTKKAPVVDLSMVGQLMMELPLKERCLCGLMFATSVRPMDLARIQMEDIVAITTSRKKFTAVTVKKHKTSTRGIGPYTFHLDWESQLSQWIRALMLRNDSSIYLFLNSSTPLWKDGREVDMEAERMVKDLLNLMGSRLEMTNRSSRRTVIQELSLEGFDIPEIQLLSRHSSRESTLKYLEDGRFSGVDAQRTAAMTASMWGKLFPVHHVRTS